MAEPTWYINKKETKIIINGEEWVPSSLLTSHNVCDYAVTPTASPKLPSVEEVMKFNSSLNIDDVQETLHAIYRLGNFA